MSWWLVVRPISSTRVFWSIVPQMFGARVGVFTLRQSKLAGEMLSMICTFHSVPPTASAGEMLRTVGTMQPGGSAQPGIPEQAFWGVRCISLTFNWHLYFTTVAFTYMLLTLHQHSTCISLTFTNILLALYMHLNTGDISQTYKHFTAADNLPRITAVLPQLPERLINWFRVFY
jgi:hypothetical protein